MSLMKFFQIIDNSFIGKFIDKRLNLIESTDPERIYVENIRSFYNISTPVAKIFCEMATKERYFEKFFAVECPNEACGRVIATFGTENEIPNIIGCDQCQYLERDIHEFKTGEYKIVEFYKLSTQVI